MIPLNDLRKALIDVIDASEWIQREMFNHWAMPYDDGHLTLDFERVESDLRRLEGRVSVALWAVRSVVVCAEDEDARFWDAVREQAA